MSSNRLQWCLKSSVLALCAAMSACTPPAPTPVTVNVDQTTGVLTANLGAEGGVVVAESSEVYEQFGISFPAGAVPAGTTVTVTPTQDETPLPENAFRVGAQFKLEASAPLAKPVTVRLPVDVIARTSAGGEASDVKVWVRDGEGWKLIEPTATGGTAVFIELSALTTVAAGVKSIAATVTCTNCPPLQVFDPPVGRPPEPCTITGGFCVEPLTGGTTLPAPVPDRFGMHVGRGRVSYTDKAVDRHVVQIRLSDLALFHVQGLLRTKQMGAVSLNSGSVITEGQVMNFLPIANAAPMAVRITVNGPTPTDNLISSPATNSARGLTKTFMRDINSSGIVSAPITRNTPNVVAILGDDAANPGGSWVVASLAPASGTGPIPGVIHRVGADGNIVASIADTAQPQLLVGGCSGGGGGFGDSLTCSVGSSGLFFASSTRLVVRSVNDASPHALLMADLTSATPTLAPLAIPPPSGFTGGEFLSVAFDGTGRVWFVFGSVSATGLFLFDPANNSVVGVPIANHAPTQVVVDGNSVIVFARSTQTPGTATIFRVRTFGQ